MTIKSLRWYAGSSPATKTANKTRKHTITVLPCFLLLCLFLSSCRNDMEKIQFFDEKELPQQALDSVRVVRSQNGKKQMLLTAPTISIIEKPESKTLYPKGLQIQIFDNNSQVVADIKADSAVSFDEKKIIELHRNIVIIDLRNGDTSYLKSLVWNSSEHRIFSMDPVKSVNGAQKTYGDGFESDDNFQRPFIIRQRGTLKVDDE